MHYFDMYRKMALLFSRGIHLSDILRALGIGQVYLYGIGEMGQIVLHDLNGTGTVKAAFDQSIPAGQERMVRDSDGVAVRNGKEIPLDDVTILISPASGYKEIAADLMAQGIAKERLLSLNVLLQYGHHFFIDGDMAAESSDRKEFLIVGANFDNKGSQAMTFVAMHELRKRYGESIIWFCPNFWDDIYKGQPYRMIVLEDGFGEDSTVYEVFPRLTAVIDVSGYAVSSLKDFGGTESVMSHIRMAYDFKVPYFMMPQSFGPLDYPGYRLAEMKVLLSSVDTIFVREEEGLALLQRKLSLTNVVASYDMVLQNKEVDRRNIYIGERKTTLEKIETAGNVAVIPNENICRYLGREETVGLYGTVVEELIRLGRNVYIVPHSNDRKLCDAIYGKYAWQKQVHYYRQEMDCLDFAELLTDFEYVVASRFHAIVHAYKKSVPCLILGWADKYRKLADDFGQGKYLFDVRDAMDTYGLISAVKKLDEGHRTEADRVNGALKKYQSDNCFDVVQARLGQKQGRKTLLAG